MIRMAICDDEPIFLEKARAAVRAFNQTHKDEVNFEVTSYTFPRLLCDDVLDGALFDAFLLDMEMEEMDGAALSAQLRGKLPTCVIIFLSSHTEFQFTQEGYKVQALRYISKLTMETALPEALEAAVQACQKANTSYYTFTRYSDSVRIPLDEILYVHRNNRLAEIVTEKQGNFQIKRPLKELHEELGDPRFVYIDRSCFANIDHIMRIRETSITLDNGENLSVSRKMMPQVKLRLLRLWGGLE